MLNDNTLMLDHYEEGEPIFLNEIPGRSAASKRQNAKKMVDDGILNRYYSGVYYIPYKTVMGTEGTVRPRLYVEKKYMRGDNGYVSGLQLANLYGFTSQNSAYFEVCSNFATTSQRKIEFNNLKCILYKPVATITPKNKSALQFLDLMSSLDCYGEIKGWELKEKTRRFIEFNKVDFEEVVKYITKYPDKTFRNMFNCGVINELVC